MIVHHDKRKFKVFLKTILPLSLLKIDQKTFLFTKKSFYFSTIYLGNQFSNVELFGLHIHYSYINVKKVHKRKVLEPNLP